MSKIEVNKVGPQCGTTVTVGCGAGQTVVVDANTVTLGRCGGTVSLASGATQSGFGRTGTVDWQTGSIKTATFTATTGEGYFCNTAGGVFEVDLPAGAAGSIVSIQDYNNTFDTYALSIDPNGSEKINGGDAGAPITLSTQGQGVTFVYIDSTVGWRSVQDNTFDAAGSNYIAASGGTETTCGDYKIHTFTGPGTFTVTAAGSPTGSNGSEYLVVAGGGGGGAEFSASVGGGGAGAGGLRFASPSLAPATYPAKPLAAPANLALSATAYPIIVGAGGTAPSSPGTTAPGSVSTFSTITSAGGGGGGNTDGSPEPLNRAGRPGGSGGGGSHSNTGGNGNDPPTSPAQGNPGGANNPPGPGPYYMGAGGGGFIAAGENTLPGAGGAGGDGGGFPTAFGSNGVPCGSFRYYAGGGGGGGSTNRPGTGPAGAGGKGGGAAGGAGQNPAPAAATTNSGGGGGGAGNRYPGGATLTGSNGGSGIVVIRYKYQN